MRWLWVVLMLLLSPVSMASVIGDGVAQMESGDLDSAIEVWQSALQQGNGSADLHYNLGVAWYRKGDLPQAIAHWRQGRLLSPRDADMVHNLAVARSELEDVVEPVETHPPLLQIATVAEWSFLSCVFFVLAALGLWIPNVRRRFGVWPPFGAAFVGCLLLTIAFSGAQRVANQPGAVVASQSAFVRKLALRHADVIGSLSAGTEVRIDRIHQDFALVSTSGDVRGWIPLDSVFVVGGQWRRNSDFDVGLATESDSNR